MMNIRHLTTAVLSALLLAGCQKEANQTESPKPVKVKTITAATGTNAGTEHYSGTVEEENGTSLSFAVAGTVKTVHIHLGQHVRAGQLIATLDPEDKQNTYNAARAAKEQAEDAYRRMKELHDKGSLPEIKWVEAQNKVEQARSMEQIAAKSLRDCNLYAPFGGVIAKKEVEAGQNVAPGVSVARIVTTSSLKVKISVPETEIAAISTGMEARISTPAAYGKQLTGTVVEKGITANPLSRSYDVKIRIDGDCGNLMPGMVADVALQSRQAGEADIVIPAGIVQIDEHNRTFVWTVAQGKAHKSIIATGGYSADGVTVISGLEKDDRIIVEGQQKVCEGTEVEL